VEFGNKKRARIKIQPVLNTISYENHFPLKTITKINSAIAESLTLFNN